jgi:hypothetical protein
MGQPDATVEPACDPTLDLDSDGLDECAELAQMTDPAIADTDGDGLLDGAEVNDHGTDPVSADSDGDGDNDGEEIDCLSDPADASEGCFECGWRRGDPGGLMSTGIARDDVIANIAFVDQCGEDISMWDFADQYSILYMTTAWCGRCKNEARELPERTRAFVERTGIPFSYIITLAESERRGVPTAADAVAYASSVGIEREVPVLADPAQQTLSHTPWDGTLPGKCIIERSTMRIVNCWTGHGDDTDAFAYIEELYAAASGG